MRMRIFERSGDEDTQPTPAGPGPRPFRGLACHRGFGDTPYGVAVTRADLRLVVENLGPLHHASVTLKPLTVLIGRNNTGKTYLAQALYAARRAVHDSRRSAPTPLTTEERVVLSSLVMQRASEEAESAQHLLEDLEFQMGELPQAVHEKARTWISQALGDVGRSLERQLCSTFGVPSTSELERWDQPKSVAVELHRVHHDSADTHLFGTNGTSTFDLGPGVSVTLDPLDYDPDGPAARFMHLSDEDDDKETGLNEQTSRDLRSATWHGFLKGVGLSGRAHYLPAGRSGLLNAWTDVVRLRIELERESLGLPTVRDPALDGVALDFISSLAGLLGARTGNRWRHRAWRPRRKRGPVAAGSLTLLREVMGGEIYAGSGDDMVPTLGYEQAGHRVPIRRASSMVADLAPLAMWIDRIVSPGDLLIIDEPESHLHPEAIRLVARVLVRLVDEGVSVVCATHSPVLIHELSNCLLLGRRQDLDAKDVERGYEASDRLSLDDIAVHRFQRPESGEPVTVTQVEIDADWGIPEDEYVDVATEQSEDTSHFLDSLA